jgi:hypothetical protein
MERLLYLAGLASAGIYTTRKELLSKKTYAVACIKDVLLSFTDLILLFRLKKMEVKGFRALCASDE